MAWRCSGPAASGLRTAPRIVRQITRYAALRDRSATGTDMDTLSRTKATPQPGRITSVPPELVPQDWPAGRIYKATPDDGFRVERIDLCRPRTGGAAETGVSYKT